MGLAGKHGGHPPSLPVQPTAADGVDAPVYLMQSASRDSTVDGTVLHPRLQQLSPPDDPVLAIRQLGNQPIPVLSRHFAPVCGVK